MSWVSAVKDKERALEPGRARSNFYIQGCKVEFGFSFLIPAYLEKYPQQVEINRKGFCAQRDTDQLNRKIVYSAQHSRCIVIGTMRHELVTKSPKHKSPTGNGPVQ